MAAERRIVALAGRPILDSHLAWTIEFEIQLSDGGYGRGSAPRGETVSIFEKPIVGASVEVVAEVAERLVGESFDQASFDDAASDLAPRWGKQVTLALSIAFFLARRSSLPRRFSLQQRPRLLLNVMNGGLHAYTNPVVSDFPEFMLQSRSDDLRLVADSYVGLLDVVRGKLKAFPTVEIGGNRVHQIGESPNEAGLAFLRGLVRAEGLESMFGIAVDASAGDWWRAGEYRLPVSGRRFAPGQLGSWWLTMVNEFGIEVLEDPLGERDQEGWRDLHSQRPSACWLLGDNYTSTDLAQLTGQAKADDLDGVLVKPNQNGTVSGTLAFAAAAREAGLVIVASHRSVETESTFLIDLAREMTADALKIGPFRDFSAVIKFNELLRQVDDPS